MTNLFIDKCIGCGKLNMPCNIRKPALCTTCYSKYKKYLTERKKCKISNGGGASRKLQQMIVDYREQAQKGYWSPRTSR